MEWNQAMILMRKAINATKFKRQSWWRKCRLESLKGVLLAMEWVDGSETKALELGEAWQCLELVEGAKRGEFRKEVRANCRRTFLSNGPFVAIVIASIEDTSAQKTILLPRSGRVEVLKELNQHFKESIEIETARRIARVAGLPLKDLYLLAGLTQASKVLDFAFSQLVGTKQFAKHNDDISLRSLRSHVRQTESALGRMVTILKEVSEEAEIERERFLTVATAAISRALDAEDLGRGTSAEVLQSVAHVAQRKAEIREAGSKAWRAFILRKFKKRLENIPELRHVARGHQVRYYQCFSFKRRYRLKGRKAEDDLASIY
jgi:ribosomal protein L17